MSTPAGSTSTSGIACAARGVREIFAVEASFVPRFVVANAPLLTPLAAAVNGMPDSLVVFVDGESVRLIPFGTEGAGEGVALESDVPGHHRQGGWALLAQSRYQRHIQSDDAARAVRNLAGVCGVENQITASRRSRRNASERRSRRRSSVGPSARHVASTCR